MNRKTKKHMKYVVVFLFFLVAGLWYVFYRNDVTEKQESRDKINGVLDVAMTDVSVTVSLEKQSPDEYKEVREDLVVYVCGAVNEPGIYTLNAGSRLYEAVTMAGGFSAEADPSYHNLARELTDSERIYILSVAETKALSAEQQLVGEDGSIQNTHNESGLINLNTATAEQLMELPGIGEAKAAGILNYRARIGAFTAIEEIMNVSGIGEAMFEKIKDKITVK